MKSITQFYVLLLVAFAGNTTLAGETNAVLLQVATKLSSAWAGFEPAPALDFSKTDAQGGSVVIYYQTDTFSVPAQSMTSAENTSTNTGQETGQEIGPKTNGFLLRISLERLGEGNQVATPSTRQESNWETFFNCTPVGGTTNQIYWVLSYGPQTDRDLLERVKQNLWQQGFSVRHQPVPRLSGEPSAPINLQVKP
jgi:hypothetical protein